VSYIAGIHNRRDARYVGDIWIVTLNSAVAELSTDAVLFYVS